MVYGVRQVTKAEPSTRQTNFELGQLDTNVKVGVVSSVGPAGPPVIVVSGRSVGVVVVTVNSRLAGVGSTVDELSMARASNVWAPAARTAVVCGDVQEANAALSTRHANVEPGLSEVKLNVGVVSVMLPVGPPVIVVCGGVGTGMPAVVLSSTDTVSASKLAVTTSGLPSPLKSSIATANGSAPVGYSLDAPKVPPAPPRRIETLLEALWPTARSGSPSASRSAIATEVGPASVTYAVGAPKVPPAPPRRTEILPVCSSAIARSGSPSALKSPAARPAGPSPAT